MISALIFGLTFISYLVLMFKIVNRNGEARQVMIESVVISALMSEAYFICYESGVL